MHSRRSHYGQIMLNPHRGGVMENKSFERRMVELLAQRFLEGKKMIEDGTSKGMVSYILNAHGKEIPEGKGDVECDTPEEVFTWLQKMATKANASAVILLTEVNCARFPDNPVNVEGLSEREARNILKKPYKEVTSKKRTVEKFNAFMGVLRLVTGKLFLVVGDVITTDEGKKQVVNERGADPKAFGIDFIKKWGN
jgi:hypothetical protein